MKIPHAWNRDAESRALYRKTHRAINTRFKESRRPATAKALRDTLEQYFHPTTLGAAYERAGFPSRTDAAAQYDVLYGLHWVFQFDSDEHVARLKEYFETEWNGESQS